MANLAEFETAPAGTERRNSPNDNWVAASLGDMLKDGNQSRNTQGQNYQVALYADAGIFFDSPATVSLINIHGEVKYKTPGGVWTMVTDAGQYTVVAVGTGPSGGGSVVCSLQGCYRPRPWS